MIKLIHAKKMFLIFINTGIGGNFTNQIKKLQENLQLTSQGKRGD